MEHFGLLSLIPPILAIGLALITKEVISSLVIASFVGLVIYSNGSLLGAFTEFFDLMAAEITDGAYIIIFLCLCGAVVSVVSKSGGAAAYGEWANKRIKTKFSAMASTSVLGMLIFVDDYFNCMTVGTVMSPITDRFKISRAKLAYVIDATAAPICALIPISSMAAYAMSIGADAGLGGSSLSVYLSSLPFNLYTIVTLIMIFFMAKFGLDFGKMAEAERYAQKTGDLGILNPIEVESDKKGTLADLIVPIVTMVGVTFLGIFYTGGMFEGATMVQSFADADINKALTYGATAALVIALCMYLPRKLMTFTEFFAAMSDGFKMLLDGIVITVLAKCIGSVCKTYLGTGAFVSEAVINSNFPLWLMPAILFLTATGIAFATGTSWGTFAMMLPIAISISEASPALLAITIASVITGGIAGDHCSPISDTTILSSSGANVNHISHVNTQLPYAFLMIAVSFVGYLVAGLTKSAILSLIVTTGLMIVSVWFLSKRDAAKAAAAENK